MNPSPNDDHIADTRRMRRLMLIQLVYHLLCLAAMFFPLVLYVTGAKVYKQIELGQALIVSFPVGSGLMAVEALMLGIAALVWKYQRPAGAFRRTRLFAIAHFVTITGILLFMFSPFLLLVYHAYSRYDGWQHLPPDFGQGEGWLFILMTLPFGLLALLVYTVCVIVSTIVTWREKNNEK